MTMSLAGMGTAAAQNYPRYPSVGSPYVPLDSWVYPAIERLAALRSANTAFLGMKPWTRLECSRLVDDAEELLGEDSSALPEVLELVHSLKEEFAPELDILGGGRNRSLRLESLYGRVAGIGGTPLTDGYHFGQTLINDFGRPFREGVNAQLGFSGWATAGRFAIYVRGEYQHSPSAPALSDGIRNLIAQVDLNPVQPAKPFATINQFRLLDAYVSLNLESWEFSFGKQSLWWGPNEGGSLILSDNAEPVLMGRISRSTPFKLPSFLGLLGPMKVDMFFGKLEGHNFPPRPFIHGERVSFKPTPRVEISFARTVVFAGVGHPFTFGTFFRSYFTLPGQAQNNGAQDPGDRRLQADFSYRLKDWLTLYNSFFWDDAIRRTAFNPGVYLPRLPGLSKLDFRAELVSTDVVPDSNGVQQGQLIYWNVVYRDAYQNKGFLLGNWVGRQGRGIQVWSTYWFSPRNTIQVSYRRGWVNPLFIPGGGQLNDFAVRAEWLVRKDLSVSTGMQYENWNYPVLSPTTKTNVTTLFQVTFHPRWTIH